MIRSMVLALLLLSSVGSTVFAQGCTGNPVALQVLGSGGPFINPDRASSSYLVWIGPQARILVDMGGGAFLRFGQSRAKLSDLWAVGISHLHPDHVSDLPALLWLSHHVRKDSLTIFGPTGGDKVPSFPDFLGRLFDEKSGAFQLMGPTLGAPQGMAGGGVRLDIGVVDATRNEPTTVFDREGVTVTALGIPHGGVPTLAYRIRARGVSIVLSSDQTGTNPGFVEFAKGADVLVMHLAIPVGMQNPLHASPAVVGRLAHEVGAKHLVLSHIGAFDVDAAVAEVKRAYSGRVTVGADLQCTPVS